MNIDGTREKSRTGIQNGQMAVLKKQRLVKHCLHLHSSLELKPSPPASSSSICFTGFHHQKHLLHRDCLFSSGQVFRPPESSSPSSSGLPQTKPSLSTVPFFFNLLHRAPSFSTISSVNYHRNPLLLSRLAFPCLDHREPPGSLAVKLLWFLHLQLRRRLQSTPPSLLQIASHHFSTRSFEAPNRHGFSSVSSIQDKPRQSPPPSFTPPFSFAQNQPPRSSVLLSSSPAEAPSDSRRKSPQEEASDRDPLPDPMTRLRDPFAEALDPRLDPVTRLQDPRFCSLPIACCHVTFQNQN